MTFDTLSTRFIALPGNVRGAVWILFATLFFAIMVALIAAVIITAVTTIGQRSNQAFTNVGNQLPAAQ